MFDRDNNNPQVVRMVEANRPFSRACLSFSLSLMWGTELEVENLEDEVALTQALVWTVLNQRGS